MNRIMSDQLRVSHIRVGCSLTECLKGNYEQARCGDNCEDGKGLMCERVQNREIVCDACVRVHVCVCACAFCLYVCESECVRIWGYVYVYRSQSDHAVVES